MTVTLQRALPSAPGTRRAPVTRNVPDTQVGPTMSRAVLPILMVAAFVQLLDATIVNVAIPALRVDLGATSGQVQLVVAGYQLAFACLLLVGGRLGDLYGRKRMFLIGMVGFVVASAACGLAQTGWQLIGARLIQGAASGLMFPQVLSILQVTVPLERRPKALGLYGAVAGLATVLGPVIGGVLLDPLSASWRLIFWVNVPIGVVAVVLALRLVPESRSPRARALDLVSLPLAVGGLFLLLLPLIVGREQGWPLWSLLAMAAAVPVLALFAVRQQLLDPWYAPRHRRIRHRRTRRGDPGPLVAPGLMRNRGFAMGLVMNIVFFAGVGPFFFVFILTLQAGLHHGALVAGLATVPFAVAAAVAATRSAGVAARLGPWVLVLGCALLMLGHGGVIATLHLAGTDIALWMFVPALVVAGLGMGLFVAPVTHLMLMGIDAKEAGAASGVLASAQQVGGSAGVAILGILFFGLLGDRPTTLVFVTSLEHSMWWEVGVFALAGLLATGLVRASREVSR